MIINFGSSEQWQYLCSCEVKRQIFRVKGYVQRVFHGLYDAKNFEFFLHSSLPSLPTLKKILHHIIDAMISSYQNSVKCAGVVTRMKISGKSRNVFCLVLSMEIGNCMYVMLSNALF